MVADYMGGGSVDAFVAMMNAEAEAIGCTGTVFTDPCGLDEGNMTTARDMYLILRALLEYDAFVEAAGAFTYQMPANVHHDAPYTIRSTNSMISPNSDYMREYTQGGKTGNLQAGWQNFASWHTRTARPTSACCCTAARRWPTRKAAAPPLPRPATLMDWVFATFTIAPALDTTAPSPSGRSATPPTPTPSCCTRPTICRPCCRPRAAQS